jgi:hypothetical protein
MQHGSLIRSGRKRGPDVWQFRWAERGLCGKRIYRKRVIGTICQYPDPDCARKAVGGLLREIFRAAVDWKRSVLSLKSRNCRTDTVVRGRFNVGNWSCNTTTS